MSFLNWNCRGLGNPRVVQFLKEIVFQKKPNVIFLCETISKKEKVEFVKSSLGYEACFVVDAVRHSGGLAMIWKFQHEGRLLTYSTNHIDMVFHLDGYPKFCFTGFYGEPQRSLRSNTWGRIRQLSKESTLPWCLMGDLNNVLSQGDKRGGRPYPGWLVDGFQEVIDECELLDMDLIGHPFTWEKGKGTPNWIEVRLDRALISNAWNSLFLAAKLFNMEVSASDHSPLWLDLAFRKPEKIKCCSTSLAEWGKDITGNFKDRIARCNKELKKLKGRRDDTSVQKYKDTHEQLFEILTQKEVFWRQRSKQLWLQAGDKNTKYFHACANTRKKNNQIVSLKNDNGVWVDWDSGLATVMIDYYTVLFAASDISWERVTNCVQGRVTTEMNHDLVTPIDSEEVKRALFQMHPDKSPGPDGFNPGFY
ncbi:uncharacterized protein LOC133031228 [Cannabis sativa]|uniref:uncharacterized protein LOC133031228 n=1 Tax=Cannabis sativa TaxID=3483 RepID=UPI0029CA5E10|nr:uncharacterized protein LOC133031228 [Cannabis sativa]